MALAPAPLSLWPLAWVALVPLWRLVLGQPISGAVALRAGAVWGLFYHGLALAWITGLHPLTWLGVPWLASVAVVGFCWGFVALWGAAISTLWTWALAVLTPQLKPGLRLLLGVALWCALEALWSQGPLWWTSLSYTQSPHNLVILQTGRLSGPEGVTAAIVAVNGLLALAWLKHQVRYGLSALALVVSLSVYGVWSLAQPLADSAAAALRVGLIQGNVPTRIKLSPEGVSRAIEGYTAGYRSLADQGVEAVLTPEGALPFLWTEPSRSRNAFYQAVRDRGVVAWLGTFSPQGNHITSNLLTLTGTGESFSHYDKVKLVPLGEYIPFQAVLGGLIDRLSPIKSDLWPGSPNQRFDTPLGRVAAAICYEVAFAELFRAQIAWDGQFILTASNLDPYSTVLMAQHHALAVMRALETDRWLAQATNTGYSSIVDPQGHTRWRSTANTYTLHADTIYRRTTQTLYVRWGDWLTPLLGALAVGGWLSARQSQA